MSTVITQRRAVAHTQVARGARGRREARNESRKAHRVLESSEAEPNEYSQLANDSVFIGGVARAMKMLEELTSAKPSAGKTAPK